MHFDVCRKDKIISKIKNQTVSKQKIRIYFFIFYAFHAKYYKVTQKSSGSIKETTPQRTPITRATM